MNVPCRQCSTPVDENAAICPVCGASNPAQRYGPAPGAGSMQMTGGYTGVTVRDIDIPFGRLVMLILKFMVAAIPAYLILTIIMFMIFAVFAGAMAAMMPEIFNQAAATPPL
ncbi:MAG TPA: hypothetical protein VF665_12810 [Longimicrobium sp.]|jgi:hypothetical protein|uniref:hypothetical protein n=1 Tax=Longimicrobium sp. TaxID=2029185 RepID=UPI002EDB2229